MGRSCGWIGVVLAFACTGSPSASPSAPAPVAGPAVAPAPVAAPPVAQPLPPQELVILLVANKPIPAGKVLEPRDVKAVYIDRTFILDTHFFELQLPPLRATADILPTQPLRKERLESVPGDVIHLAPSARPSPDATVVEFIVSGRELEAGHFITEDDLLIVEGNPATYRAMGCPYDSWCYQRYSKVIGQYTISRVLAYETIRSQALSVEPPPGASTDHAPGAGWVDFVALKRTVEADQPITSDDLTSVYLPAPLQHPDNPIVEVRADTPRRSVTRLLAGELLRERRQTESTGSPVTITSKGPPEISTKPAVDILWTARDLDKGHHIEESDYVVVSVNPTAAAALGCEPLTRCYTPTENAAGQYASEAIFVGEPLRKERVVGSKPGP